MKELRQQIDRGIDPLGEKQQRRKAPTFADIAKEYLERHAVNKKSGKAYAAVLDRDVLPMWGKRKAEDIKRRDVIALVEAKAKSAPVGANRLLELVRGMFNWAISCDLLEYNPCMRARASADGHINHPIAKRVLLYSYLCGTTLELVRGMFNWAISRDLLEYNPCIQVKAPTKEKSRERVLSADEIRIMWSVLDAAPITPVVAGVLRFILTTAQRPGETCAAEWTEIDHDWWTIPGSKTKNGLAHRVPLSSLALEILSERPKTGKYVFPSRYRSRNTHTSEPSIANAVNLNGCFRLPHWTPHDLRRSGASHMASLEIARFVVGRVLNHAEPGVTKIYDRHSYDAEKRAALERWERRLRTIIGVPVESKVVEISR